MTKEANYYHLNSFELRQHGFSMLTFHAPVRRMQIHKKIHLSKLSALTLFFINVIICPYYACINVFLFFAFVCV